MVQCSYALGLEAAESKIGCEMDHEGIQVTRGVVVERREAVVVLIYKEIPTSMRVAFPLVIAGLDEKLLIVQHEVGRMENDQLIFERAFVETLLVQGLAKRLTMWIIKAPAHIILPNLVVSFKPCP